jgi:hypothetical protein
MKLLHILSTVLGIVEAVLPPGYEDKIWCPPSNCRFFTDPFGFAGPLSSFNKCFNPTSDVETEGVWTGSLTDVTPPHGWIEPDMCTAAEYSQCETKNDCETAIRTKVPVDEGGACNCYVNSVSHPFDQCVGMAPNECKTVQCGGDECEYYVASCAPGENGTGGTCTIRLSDQRQTMKVCIDTGKRFGKQTLEIPAKKFSFYSDPSRTSPAVEGVCKGRKTKSLTKRASKTSTFCRRFGKKWFTVEAPRVTANWLIANGFAVGTCRGRNAKTFEMKYIKPNRI